MPVKNSMPQYLGEDLNPGLSTVNQVRCPLGHRPTSASVGKREGICRYAFSVLSFYLLPGAHNTRVVKWYLTKVVPIMAAVYSRR